MLGVIFDREAQMDVAAVVQVKRQMEKTGAVKALDEVAKF